MFSNYSGTNQRGRPESFCPLSGYPARHVSCSILPSREPLDEALRSTLCSPVATQQCGFHVFPPGRRPNTPARADPWAVSWTRTLRSQEQTVRPAGRRRIPGWRRGGSGHSGTGITWAGRTCTLLPIYPKDMVCGLKRLNRRFPWENGLCLLLKCEILLIP